MQLVWSDEAIASFQSLESSVFNQWGEEVAEGFAELLDEKLELLLTNPLMGVQIPNTPYRRLIVHANVSIFYSVQKNVIRILLCWDNRRDPNDLIEFLKP